MAELRAALARAEQALRDRRRGEADGICRDILRDHPGQPAAQGIRGLVAAGDGDLATALAMLEPAAAADPTNPAWRNALADVYRMQCRLDEAVALARQAASVMPRQAGFVINLARALHDRGDLDDAAVHFLAALAVEPANAEAHLGIAQMLLARGEWRAGWIEYEWRNQLEQARGRYPDIHAPLWTGMRLPGGRVMLIADQGYGDTIQFARYIPMVAERCAEVVVGCSPELRALLDGMPGLGRTFDGWRDIPGFTAYQLMSSLPYVFDTTADSIPPAPYLHPDPARVAQWRQADPGRPFRVGLCWSGRPTHPNDVRRSMRLAALRPLAEAPGVQFVNLQKDIPAADQADLAAFPGLDERPDLPALADTAALMATLDLVLTVDSAVGHLAGAIGRPVWVMVASPADWRWQLGRTDSPWYPTMRLFRQPVPGAWAPVIAEIAAALRDVVNRPDGRDPAES